MLPFHKVVKNDFRGVNQLIIDQLHSSVDLVENIGHYLVEAGGKRLRPLLVLLTTNALGYKGRHHWDLAAVIEFIHTATLLHDDVVDISSLRRGRPTANAKWGNAPSVLVGDFLYSRAFQMMVAIGEMDIMNTLADTTNTISEGEVQQLVNAKNPEVSEQDYLTVIHKKTAVLFEAACETAAILSYSESDQSNTLEYNAQRAALRRYGYHLGLAFQLVDDALDYEGDAEALGKNIGDDLAEGKPTLPLIYAMKQGSATEALLIANAIREGAVDQLATIVDIVKKTGGLTYTYDYAKREADKAVAQLSQLPTNIYNQAMVDLASFAVNRCY